MCFFRKRKQRKLEEQRKAEEAARLAKEKELAEAKAKAEAEEKARLEAEEKAKAEEEAKKAAAKKPAAKKPAAKKASTSTTKTPKKAPVKKAAEPQEEETVVEEKVEEPVKVDTSTQTINKIKDSKSVYHVSKREDDGMWQIKYTGGRVIKLCKTKVEAMNYAKEMAANQEGTVIFHPSKGANKGKFQKA